MQDHGVDANSGQSQATPAPDTQAAHAGATPLEVLQRLQTVVAAVDASPLVIFLWRFVGGQEWPVDFASGGVGQFGYTPEDFLSGRISWVSVTHPEDVPHLEAEVARYHAQGVTEFFQEYRIFTKSGEVRWVDDRTFAVRNAAGAITHYAGAIRDITPRKDAQTRMAEQHATLHAIMNSVDSSIFAVDRAYCYTGFNTVHQATMRRLHGAEVRIGGCLLDYIPAAEDRENARRNFDRAFRGERFSIEAQDDTHATGRETTILTFNPIRGEGDAIIGASVVLRDVTAERTAAERVRSSEEWFRALVEHAYGMIVVTDREGIILYVSANTERLMGHTNAETLGRDIFEFLHAEDDVVARRAFADMMSHPEAAIISRFRVRHRDGRWRWIETAGQNLLDTPAVAAVVLNLRDITEREEMEQALRESEDRLRLALQDSPILVYHADRELRYTWIHNTRHGMQAQNVIGKRDDELLPAADVAPLMGLKRRVLESGRPERAQICLHPQGESAIYDVNVEPRRGEGGAIIGVSVVASDITTLKRAEAEVHRLNAELERRVVERTAELAESEERYRLLFNAQSHAVIVFDAATWRVVDANEAALSLYGYLRAEVLRLTCQDIFAVAEQVGGVIKRILDGDYAPTLLAWQRRRDGAVIPVEVSPYALRQQGRQVVAMVMRDLSVIAEAERLLRESESKFRVLAEESPNMIFINQRGRVVYVNQCCVDVMGYTREEFYAADFDFMCLIDAESAAEVRSRFDQRQQGVELEPYELVLRTKTGRRLDAILATRSIDYQSGKAIVGIVTDLTASREGERMRIRQQERLQRLAAMLAVAQDEEQRRIADGLHDDVAQVLTACRYRLAELREGMTAEAVRETRANLDELLGQAQTTIRSLSFELASSTLHQRELGPAIEALCQAMTQRYGVQFAFRQSGPSVALNVEATVVLFKATRELLFNVLKHAGVDQAVVTVSSSRTGLSVQVEDEGRGFTRAAGPAAAELGRGLGLYKVRERLRDVGGRMRVESQPGVRTRITLTAPLAEE